MGQHDLRRFDRHAAGRQRFRRGLRRGDDGRARAHRGHGGRRRAGPLRPRAARGMRRRYDAVGGQPAAADRGHRRTDPLRRRAVVLPRFRRFRRFLAGRPVVREGSGRGMRVLPLRIGLLPAGHAQPRRRGFTARQGSRSDRQPRYRLGHRGAVGRADRPALRPGRLFFRQHAGRPAPDRLKRAAGHRRAFARARRRRGHRQNRTPRLLGFPRGRRLRLACVRGARCGHHGRRGLLLRRISGRSGARRGSRGRRPLGQRCRRALDRGRGQHRRPEALRRRPRPALTHRRRPPRRARRRQCSRLPSSASSDAPRQAAYAGSAAAPSKR